MTQYTPRAGGPERKCALCRRPMPDHPYHLTPSEPVCANCTEYIASLRPPLSLRIKHWFKRRKDRQ